MRLSRLAKRTGFLSIFVVTSMVLSSCNGITEEQLAKLNELRETEQRLESEVAQAKNQLSKINKELAARKKELNDCTKDKNFVTGKLSQWPNVWPDYNPSSSDNNNEENK